jgi:transposase
MDAEPLNLLGVPPEDWARTPESVRLAVLSLLDIVRVQSGQIADLQTHVRDLQAKVGQTSRNSSKPPSSAPPSAPPKPPKVARGRNAGGQPGHAGHQRPLVPPERVDEAIDLLPAHCPHCQTRFVADAPTIGDPRRTQVWELPAIQPRITEYRQHTCCCPTCRQVVTATLPTDAPPGAFGPRATALMALLRGDYRLSLDETVDFLAQVCQLPVSPGCVVTTCERASAVLAPLDATIQQAVQAAPQVNVDETSWPMPAKRGWLWAAVAETATCFRLHRSRGQEGLTALLGATYRGIVMSDRLATYDLLPDGQRHVCWAHLVRNVRALDERYGAETGWARVVLAQSDTLFFAWHLYRGGWLDRVGLQQALLPVRHGLRDLLEAGTTSPQTQIAGLSRKLLRRWEALFAFCRIEGIEPTNNAAERALRHAVLWRKGSFGSRSDEGCRFVERLLSVRATCAQQGRRLFTFLTEAVCAAWAGTPPPVLVASPVYA